LKASLRSSFEFAITKKGYFHIKQSNWGKSYGPQKAMLKGCEITESFYAVTYMHFLVTTFVFHFWEPQSFSQLDCFNKWYHIYTVGLYNVALTIDFHHTASQWNLAIPIHCYPNNIVDHCSITVFYDLMRVFCVLLEYLNKILHK